MSSEKLTELGDEELLAEAKKMKSTSITNAVLIGVFIGIAVYSTVRNGLGLLTFLPLLMVFKAIRDSKKQQPLEAILKERKLKP